MTLSSIDVFLTWDDLKDLLRNSKQVGFAIHDIKSTGANVVVEGEASKYGFTANWSVCLEPMVSDDGCCIVFHIKSFKLKEGCARFGFKFFKNFLKFDWFRNSEEFLAEMGAKIITKNTNGAWAEDSHLLVHLASVLAEGIKTSVQVGKIKHFRSDKRGLRLIIESA